MVVSLTTSNYVSVDRVWKLFNFFPFLFAKWVGTVLTGLPMPAVLQPLSISRLIHILHFVCVHSPILPAP